MRHFGYVKVGAAIPSVRVADVDYNVAQIKALIRRAVADDVEIVCFPELCITGYTCQDLFRSTLLLSKAADAVEELTDYCRSLPIVAIVGTPTRQGNRLFNSAVVIAAGEHYIVNKTYLPNYGEFYEQRWFAAEDADKATVLFALPSGVQFAVEICEDLWTPIPRSSRSAVAGADLIFNLSASDELIAKHKNILFLIAQQSARCIAGYVYSSAGFGESTQDVVYAGNAIIYENGQQLAHSQRFSLDEQLLTAQVDIERLRSERQQNTTFCHAQEEVSSDTLVLPIEVAPPTAFTLVRTYDPHPFVPRAEDRQATCEEVFNIQVMGLAQRLRYTGCHDVVLGISGGLDSTLALLVCAATFDKLGLDRAGIHGITMPGLGTSAHTRQNAAALMTALHITQREIPIAAAIEQHFADIQHDAAHHDTTYENAQARYRTMLLMDIANQVGGLVIGTGDLSELALGWCTYGGDHMSMYAVNIGVPKTLVQHLVAYVAENKSNTATQEILRDILATPISPELTPTDKAGQIAQKSEDILGPYELHDFFIYHFLRFGFAPEKLLLLAQRAYDGTQGVCYDEQTIRRTLYTFLRRFFANQFKRSCLPDGPKVGSVSLSPRGDWRMPSDAAATAWLAALSPQS